MPMQLDVDRQRVCASGFSDGASYALSLGAANGDLFTHIAAFSPGFMRPPVSVGEQCCFVVTSWQGRAAAVPMFSSFCES